MLTNAITDSCCCASSTTKSGLPSLSRSIDRHVDRAGARIEHLRHEHRRLPVGRPVLEQRDVAGGAPAEAADDHVEVAVAVEVGGAGVGGARQLGRERHGDERAVGAPPQPVDGAVGVVGRLERAEVGDEEVAAPVLVEIDRLDVGGVAQPGDRLQRVARPWPGRAARGRSASRWRRCRGACRRRRRAAGRSRWRSRRTPRVPATGMPLERHRLAAHGRPRLGLGQLLGRLAS